MPLWEDFNEIFTTPQLLFGFASLLWRNWLWKIIAAGSQQGVVLLLFCGALAQPQHKSDETVNIFL